MKQRRRKPTNSRAGHRPFSCLYDLLVHYAHVAPHREAILAPGRVPVTYGALLAQTDQTLRELRTLGVGRSDRVAVVLPNGPEAAMAIVAVAAGAVCVPLNPAFTFGEWQRYFSDVRVTALLTRADMESASRDAAHALGIPVIDLSLRSDEGSCAFNLTGSARQCSDDGRQASGGDDAFILLTSGTTSRPKIVPLTQAGACRSAYNAGASLALGHRDRLLNVMPLFHAHGLFSGVLTALAAGSSVVCTSGFDADAFFGWLKAFQPTWYTAVPTIHRAVLATARRHPQDARKRCLRLVRSASSSLPADVLGGLEALFGVPVIETYGMTEAASQIAANPVARRKLNSVGKSAGAEIAITDADGRRLPAGELGEIVLRGSTMTRGYDGDAAATAEAFRDGWFRTGDLGYLDEDGYLFIRGRLKDVINRGGQKVAPAEVEEALLSHPDVVEAAVFSIPHARLGEDVAAAIVLRPDAVIDARALQDFARERLAGYKVPNLIRTVPEIPKGASGKINRPGLAAALSITAPLANAASGNDLPLPRSDLERELAKIWSDLLEVRRIGVDEDIFALGADSLTITQMLSRVRARFGVNLSFKDVLDARTAATLAFRIEASERGPAAAPLGLRDMRADADGVRLSFQQQRIHVLSRLEPVAHSYHLVEVARLSGPLNVDALERSITTICRRHEALRSTFPERSGEPMQTVATAPHRVERLDFGPCAKGKRAAAIRQQALETLRRSFDMDKEALLQTQLLRFDDHDHALVIKLHHIVSDGWSQRLFWEELEKLYAADGKAASANLPKIAVQYRHFAEWQRAWLQTPAAEQQRRYWRQQLDGLTELPLRTDRPRPEKWTGRGARHPLRLSRTLTRRIKSLSRGQGVTLFMTLLAAFQCLLQRHTGHDDVAVGSLIANRNQIDIERLIGMFANTIVLRTDLSGDPTFSEVLRRVRHVTLDAYRNQDLPIEEVLPFLQVSRNADRHALYRSMFILQNGLPTAPVLSGLSTRFMDIDPGVARVDLVLELREIDQRLGGWIEYSNDLFDAGTITRMAAHLQCLLEAIVHDPDERVSRLNVLPEAERRQLLVDWNDTRTDWGRPGTFAERFARQAKRSPDAIAVSTELARLSYRDLARRSRAIAGRLAGKGVGPDAVIVLLGERNIDFLAAMIGVQQAGAAFLPVDPAIPPTRLTRIIQHSRSVLVLAGQGSAEWLEAALSLMPARGRPKVLNLERAAQLRSATAIRPAGGATSSLAYVIYTSGSTGEPKGAMIEQRGLVNHLLFQIADLELSASDVVAQTATQSFDISIWQFLTPLIVGARVHICTDEEVRDPALLVQAIAREGVTVLQIVPSLLRGILESMHDEPAFRALGRLRVLVCTGEAVDPDLLRDWFRHFADVPVVNAYGPAECSDDVATHRLTIVPASLDTVPIGRPIANTCLYVLDPHLQPTPVGVTGELYVGGAGVGRGYLNDPDLSRRSFIRDPFSTGRSGRLYRTGDLARWRADGKLEFLGRLDHQVKIRGYRIELGEIERALAGHPAIRAAAVLVRDDPGGEPRLVAYVAAAGGRQPLEKELRDFLKSRLSGYMVPAAFIFLPRLPLTPHGKVDRGALAAIRRGLRAARRDEAVAPRNSTEQALADIWADVLEVEGIGVFDNFFDLGGHSLLAGKVLVRAANAFGARLPIKAFFEAPTIKALARRIDLARQTQSGGPTLEIERVATDEPPQVSIVQENVLRNERALPGLPQFNLPFAYRLRGSLNVSALERSLAEIVRRHDSLRTRFVWEGQQPVAVVAAATDASISLAVEDVAAGALTGNDRAKALLLQKAKLRAEQESWTPFDIARAPLFRVRLLRLAADDHVLVLILHHIIVDGWSIGVFMEELSELYAAFSTGRDARLPEPAIQFPDFARWQRSWSGTDPASRQVSYWKEQLRNSSALFPTSGDRANTLLNSPIAHDPVHLPNDLVARLSALSRRRGVTLFMTCLSGFKALLMARSGRNDICVATAMANRSHLSTERMIGPLENTTLIRTRMDEDLPFQEALERVRTSVLEAYSRQELPYELLAAKLEEEDGLDPASIGQAFFAVRDAAHRPLSFPEVAVHSFGDPYREGQPVLPIDRTWLTVLLKQTSSGITGSCSYKTDLFESDSLQEWIADYTTILAKAAANPEIALGRLVER